MLTIKLCDVARSIRELPHVSYVTNTSVLLPGTSGGSGAGGISLPELCEAGIADGGVGRPGSSLSRRKDSQIELICCVRATLGAVTNWRRWDEAWSEVIHSQEITAGFRQPHCSACILHLAALGCGEPKGA